jgi:hypothetical protein
MTSRQRKIAVDLLRAVDVANADKWKYDEIGINSAPVAKYGSAEDCRLLRRAVAAVGSLAGAHIQFTVVDTTCVAEVKFSDDD